MKYVLLTFAAVCLQAFSSVTWAGAGSIRVAPAPEGEPLSARFTVKVENSDVPVYVARVVALSVEQREKLAGTAALADTTDAAFSSFDTDGAVSVIVTFAHPVSSAKILPSSSGIVPTISGNTIHLTISKPMQLTLEVNDDWLNSLHLFANPMEKDVPRADDPNVIYFRPGVHEIGPLRVPSGKTVYVAAGAVVYGKVGVTHDSAAVLGLGGSNIVVRGRGIVDGSRLPRGSGGVLFAQGQNISIEGVVLRDSSAWTCHLARSDNVNIQNVKIFGWRGNSDGIDICNSRTVAVRDCFLRTFDDLVVVKTNDDKGGPTRDVAVKHCILWNEFAHALSLGAEMRTPVENVSFSDCDVIRDKGREWDLRVYHCDSGPIKNIDFDNIRIEESRRLFSVWIGKAMWSHDLDRGTVDGVTFRNIASVAPTRANAAPAELIGVDAQHEIDDVRFDHVTLAGQPLRADEVYQNAFVQRTSITP